MKKYLIIIACVLAPTFVSAESAACTNSNILAYFTPETLSVENQIIFYVPSFVQISSLEASLRGEHVPVQYKNYGLLTRAKVIIPDTLEGVISGTLGAQSLETQCNEPLSFSFKR